MLNVKDANTLCELIMRCGDLKERVNSETESGQVSVFVYDSVSTIYRIWKLNGELHAIQNWEDNRVIFKNKESSLFN